MPEEIAPRELVFVLDCSGSMGGDPIEKSKAVVRHALAAIREGDTFRVLRFANQATGLSHRALPATSENIRRAVEFLDSLRAGGGTEGLTGIRAALNPPIEPGRHRIVCFLTDGIIGNEAQILAAVEDLRKGARLFSFGVGESVNRYLLDKLASRGRGAVQYVLPEMPADEAAERFCRRLRSPWLTDIDIDFGGLPVADIFPQRLPDLFPGAPLLVVGRYLGGGEGVLTVRGRRAGRLWERKISVKLPEWEERNEVLAPVWARCEIESVMDWLFQRPREARERITDLGLEFRLVTPFTSFIAADGSWTAGGAVRTVRIPIAMPDGVIYSGALGDRGEYCEIRPLGVLLEAAPRGMRVFRVREGSPAESAGVLEGDVLLTVNGTPVQNGREVRNATAIGPDRQNLRVRREGVRLVEVEFTSLDRERTEPR